MAHRQGLRRGLGHQPEHRGRERQGLERHPWLSPREVPPGPGEGLEEHHPGPERVRDQGLGSESLREDRQEPARPSVSPGWKARAGKEPGNQ